MIDIRKLKELVRLMVDNDLTELDLRDSEEQVTVRRPNASTPPQVMSSPAYHVPAVAHTPAAATSVAPAPQPAAGAKSAVTESADEAGLIRIESPMVGTFYASPKPDAAAFVSPGSTVNPDTVVCIIEAMKIFNEIKAETSGVVHKMLVKNGEPVEFGQTLFLLKPS